MTVPTADVPEPAPPQTPVQVPEQVPGRLHVMRLVSGLLDSRLSHVDFLDTEGGEELARLYRHRRSALMSQLHRRSVSRHPERRST